MYLANIRVAECLRNEAMPVLSSLAVTIWKRILALSGLIANTGCTLLPKLMSGEVGVMAERTYGGNKLSSSCPTIQSLIALGFERRGA